MPCVFDCKSGSCKHDFLMFRWGNRLATKTTKQLKQLKEMQRLGCPCPNCQPLAWFESQRWSKLCWLVKRVELLPVKVCWCGTETDSELSHPFGSPAFSLEMFRVTGVTRVIVWLMIPCELSSVSLFHSQCCIRSPIFADRFPFCDSWLVTVHKMESRCLSAKGKGGIGSTLKITENGSRAFSVFLHIFWPRVLNDLRFVDS